MSKYTAPDLNETEPEKDVFAFFGLLIYNYQCFEENLTTLYISHTLMLKKAHRDDHDKLRSKLREQTMGRLVNNLKPFFNKDEFEKLEFIKDKRNYYAHDFFKDYAATFTRDPLKMATILKEEIDSSSEIIAELDDIVRLRLKDKFGISEEILNEIAEDILQNDLN